MKARASGPAERMRFELKRMGRHFKRFTAMMMLAWLAGSATVTIYLYQFAAEDFSVGDLIPFLGTLFFFGAPLSFGSIIVLIRLSEKVGGRVSLALFALTSAVSMALPPAVYTAARAFFFKNLPTIEFVLFSVSFLVMGLTLGLAFLCFYHPRKWLLIVGYICLTIGSIVFFSSMVPHLHETVIADRKQGVVEYAVAMSEPRSAHTATLLQSGQVLFIGGMVSVAGQELPTASAEIFDPSTNRLSSAGRMSVARAGHTATLLDNGDVLITGGMDADRAVTNAELYIASTSEFLPVGGMQVARERHSATLLKNGSVLITGGTVAQSSDAAEIYDPATRAFRAVSRMQSKRAAQTSTLLPDGRVMVAGGAQSPNSVLESVELFDPDTETFQAATPLRVRRYKHSAVLLPDGRVCILGGADERDWSGRRYSVEIYDPASNSSEIVGTMNRARFKFTHSAVLSVHGRLVVAGAGRQIEIFDESTNSFLAAAGTLGDEWFYSTATALPDGRVLIAGGYNSSLIPTNRLWLYQPPN